MIRPATQADAAAILSIWNWVIRDTTITFNPVEKTLDEVQAFLADKAAQGYGVFVADLGAGVQGYASYGQFRAGNGYAHTLEHSIALLPASHGRGLGRGLMTAIEDHARARGGHSLFAGVSGENPHGRAFHAALGYREVAVLPQVGFKFGRWLDLVLMQKFLT